MLQEGHLQWPQGQLGFSEVSPSSGEYKDKAGSSSGWSLLWTHTRLWQGASCKHTHSGGEPGQATGAAATGAPATVRIWLSVWLSQLLTLVSRHSSGAWCQSQAEHIQLEWLAAGAQWYRPVIADRARSRSTSSCRGRAICTSSCDCMVSPWVCT